MRRAAPLRSCSSVLVAMLIALSGALVLGVPADAATPRLLVYGGSGGVVIRTPAQAARKLPGSPRDFQRYVARLVAAQPAVDPCTGAGPGMSVQRVRTDGFARGINGSCTGHMALWKRVGGRWREIAGTQEFWSCRTLRRWAVPSSVVAPRPTCWNGAALVTYRHA